MARNVLLILGSGLGSNLGPNFNLTSDAGAVTPSTATRTQLLNGLIVSVNDATTSVTVTSTGPCANSITQSLPCPPLTTTSTTSTTSTTTSTTSTTSTTTAPPTTTSTTSTSTTTTTTFAPLPVFNLLWTTSSASYPQCPGSGWVVTNNNQTIRFNISDSGNCGGTCDRIQSGSAEATITVGGTNVNMSLDFDGLVEQQDAGFENIIFKLNGTEIARATSRDLNLECTMGPVDKIFTTPSPYLLTAGSIYTLRIDFTTGDAAYHKDSFYQAELGFITV